MTASRIAVPRVLETVSAEDVESVERWALLRRSELVRMGLELRAVTQSMLLAEEQRAARSDDASSLLAAVDSTLRNAANEANEAIDAAVAEGLEIVATARSLAENLVRLAGLDPEDFESLTPAGLGADRTAIEVPSADDLWNDIVESLRSTPTTATSDAGSVSTSMASAGRSPLPAGSIPSTVTPLSDDSSRDDHPSAQRPVLRALQIVPDHQSGSKGHEGVAGPGNAPSMSSSEPFGGVGSTPAIVDPVAMADGDFWAAVPEERPGVGWLRRRTAWGRE